MGKSDALSWRANHGTGSNDNSNITLLTPAFFTACTLHGVELVGEAQSILGDIHKGTRDGGKEEPVAKVAKELMASNSWLVCSAEWSFTAGILYFCRKIYVLDHSDSQRRVVALCHALRLVDMLAGGKLELVSHNYWWPQMSYFITLPQ